MKRYHGMKICNGEILNFIKFITILLMLSTLLGICTLVLTVLPCDLNLIKALLLDSKVLFMNIWPILCVMLILCLALNRIWIGFLGTGLLIFMLAEINRFKMTFRDDPFVFSDILLIDEAKEMIGEYSLFLDIPSICGLVFIITTTVFCFFLFKTQFKSKIIRVIGIFFASVLMLFSCVKFYLKDYTIYNSMWHSEFGNQWKAANQYMSRGVVYSFIRSISNAIITSPEGYSERETKQIMDNYQDVPLKEDKKVHIISIMLEAYNDFSEFEGIEFIEDPYENFHSIQNQSYHGKLFTDIFAAGTIKTERSFLTGYNDTEFADKDTESYIRYFKNQGYYTEAMHPCYGWFYNRKNICTYLGFDNFEYHENKYCMVDISKLSEDLYHNLLADYDFFDYIIEGYKRSLQNEKKYFNFSVTYQNHGPYASEKETNEEYVLKKDEYTEDEYNIFNNYLAGIARTDRALGKLRQFVDTQNEPIVLILFGDHNPWLGDNNSVYDMLGIDLNLDTVEGAKNYYQTPYVFYANEVARKQLKKEFNELGNTVSPIFLMSEYFEYVGIEGSAYLNYLHTVKEQYSVLNSVYVGSGETYALTSELKDDEILKCQEQVEYYMKTKKIGD